MEPDLQHHWGKTMEHDVGIDVSLEQSSVCVVDGTGRILRETKVASEPEALIGMPHVAQRHRHARRPVADHPRGRDAVRSYYEDLLRAVPDLHIEVLKQHVSGDVVVLECEITGTHDGVWHGLPATGRPVKLPLCGVYTFAEDSYEIAGERFGFGSPEFQQEMSERVARGEALW